MKQAPPVPPGPWIFVAILLDIIGFALIASGFLWTWEQPMPYLVIGLGVLLLALSTGVIFRLYRRTRGS